MRDSLHKLIQPFIEWWSSHNESTRAIPVVLWEAIRNFSRYGSRQSAALAFYSIFSVFPLTLLLAVLVGGLLEPAVAQEQIANGLRFFLPENTVQYIQSSLGQALQQAGSFGVIAIIAILWSALGLFSNITASLDEIFDVPEGRSMWKQRLLAFVMSITLVILVIASFVTSGVLRLVSALLLDQPSLWVTIGIIFLPFGLDVVIFSMLFRFVPARYVHWDAVLPAAMFGAMGWELAKTGFGWYLNNLANYQFIYGSIATGIVLLFWANLIAAIFLFSAELCARLNEWMIGQEARPSRVINRQYSISLQDGQIRVRMPDSTDGPPIPK